MIPAMTGFLIDPAPGLHPHCVCDMDCEMPCWQRLGIDGNYDPSDKRSCCCRSRSQPPLPLSNRSMLEMPKMTFERWLQEYHRAEA